MTGLRQGDPRGVVERFLIKPVRELHLAIRDMRSPEMREIRDGARVAELNRGGEGRYVMVRALGFLAAFEGFAVLTTLASVLSGHDTWSIFWSGAAFRSFVIMGFVFFVVGAIAGGVQAARLAKEYPDDVAPPKP